MRRVVAVAALLVAGIAHPGLTAGTGGIELTPVPGVVDGKQVTAFHVSLPADGEVPVHYALRNITTQATSARVYAASARPDGQGGYAIGDAGSSPYVELPDRTVELGAKEERRETFVARAPEGRRSTDTLYAALVVEVQRGSVVQRAATMVYLEPGAPAALPGWVRPVAVAALAVVLAGLAAVLRRRRPPAAPVSPGT